MRNAIWSVPLKDAFDDLPHAHDVEAPRTDSTALKITNVFLQLSTDTENTKPEPIDGIRMRPQHTCQANKWTRIAFFPIVKFAIRQKNTAINIVQRNPMCHPPVEHKDVDSPEKQVIGDPRVPLCHNKVGKCKL